MQMADLIQKQSWAQNAAPLEQCLGQFSFIPSVGW